MSVLILADSDGKTIDQGVLSCVTAALNLSKEVDIICLDSSENVVKKCTEINA